MILTTCWLFRSWFRRRTRSKTTFQFLLLRLLRSHRQGRSQMVTDISFLLSFCCKSTLNTWESTCSSDDFICLVAVFLSFPFRTFSSPFLNHRQRNRLTRALVEWIFLPLDTKCDKSWKKETTDDETLKTLLSLASSDAPHINSTWRKIMSHCIDRCT